MIYIKVENAASRKLERNYDNPSEVECQGQGNVFQLWLDELMAVMGRVLSSMSATHNLILEEGKLSLCYYTPKDTALRTVTVELKGVSSNTAFAEVEMTVLELNSQPTDIPWLPFNTTLSKADGIFDIRVSDSKETMSNFDGELMTADEFSSSLFKIVAVAEKGLNALPSADPSTHPLKVVRTKL